MWFIIAASAAAQHVATFVLRKRWLLRMLHRTVLVLNLIYGVLHDLRRFTICMISPHDEKLLVV